MRHTYSISGMHCDGCRNRVEEALKSVKGVTSVSVNLAESEAIIEMDSHIPLEKFEDALKKSGGKYFISLPGNKDNIHKKRKAEVKSNHEIKGSGVFYCPMHCEGEKTYDKPGSCPVCGMDLVEQPSVKRSSVYTCPMHPEIIRNEPGSCPICGMDLVPAASDVEEEDKTYKNLL